VDPKSKSCKASHLAIILTEVNAGERRARQKSPKAVVEEKGSSRSLNRHEWLEALVRMSVARFVAPGVVTDVSDALRMLLEELMKPNLEPIVLQDSNVFRRACCCAYSR